MPAENIDAGEVFFSRSTQDYRKSYTNSRCLYALPFGILCMQKFAIVLFF